MNSDKIEIQRKYIQEVKEINNDKIAKTKEFIRTSQKEASDHRRNIDENKTKAEELLAEVAGFDVLLGEIKEYEKLENKKYAQIMKTKDY